MHSKRIKLWLTPAEMSLAREVAAERHDKARGRGVKDRRISGKLTSLEVEEDGAAAELAFSRLLRQRGADLRFEMGKPGEPDFVVNENRIDVKHTRLNWGNLMVSERRMLSADWWVLIIGTAPQLWFAGWISTEKMIQVGPLKNLNGRPVWVVPQKELMAWDRTMLL